MEVDDRDLVEKLSMESSFKNRVEHVFGALLGSSLQSGRLASSSWSVRDLASPSIHGAAQDEHESSDSDNDEPCAARYENFVRLSKRGRRGQFSDDDEGEDSSEPCRVAKRRRSGESSELQDSAGAEQQDLDEDEECRQMRLMVGMDDTLDFEEEEDEYDKVAVGREGAGERVYMREIARSGSDLNPTFERDARANHAAAVARLREDDKLAASRSAEMLKLSICSGSSRETVPSGNEENIPDADTFVGCSVDTTVNGFAEAEKSNCIIAGKVEPRHSTSHQSELQIGSAMELGILQDQQRSSANLEGQHHSRVDKVGKFKKVRFSLDDGSNQEKGLDSVSLREAQRTTVVPMWRNKYTRVPDHVRNPSKYTHYTLDWSDEEDDNRANLAAFQATRALAQAPEKQEVVSSILLPKSITFTPRNLGVSSKMDSEAKITTVSGSQQVQPLVSFAGDSIADNSSSLEDSVQGITTSRIQVEAKTARVFRKRAREERNDEVEASG